jgi:hypothetical protein
MLTNQFKYDRTSSERLLANGKSHDVWSDLVTEMYTQSWYRLLHEADQPIVDREWVKLLAGATVSFEVRLKPPFLAEEIVPGEKVEGFTWIIAAAYPERDINGTVIGILGCLTDISRQKWMEGFQTRKMMEAVELKRQQENFIDMTSQ